jgi:hypothetical protein
MIATRRHEFTPPNGGPPITVHGLQDYSPGQSRKVEVWKLDVPAVHAVQFGGHVEFDNWKVMIATLARMFCSGDEKAASDRMVLKWSDQPSL